MADVAQDTALFAPFCRELPRFALSPRHMIRSTPHWTRTSNLRFRRPMLYPIELGVQLPRLPRHARCIVSATLANCLASITLPRP